jgi:hypothetical protein
VAEANSRSHAKATLFDGVVKRLEAQMAVLVPGAGKGSKPVGRKATPKRARTAGHRAARASLKAEMTTKAAALNTVASKPAKRAVAKPAAQVAAAPAPIVAVPASKRAARVKPAATVKKSRTAAKAKPAPAIPGGQAIRFDGAKQRLLRAGAKKARLASSGIVTQRGGHAMAAAKRSQARRDKRGR